MRCLKVVKFIDIENRIVARDWVFGKQIGIV